MKKLAKTLLVASVIAVVATGCEDTPKLTKVSDSEIGGTCDIHLANPEQEFKDVPRQDINYDVVGIRGYAIQFNVDGYAYISSNYTMKCKM